MGSDYDNGVKLPEKGGNSLNPSDPVLQILQSYGGRQGVGFSLQRLSEIASLGLDRAQAPYQRIDPLLTQLYDRARGDLVGAYGGERQRVADTQSQAQSRINQQLGQSGLGSLRASASGGLEQQALRQYQGIADQQGRSLAELGAREGTARSQGLQALGGFLSRRTANEQAIAQLKTDHIVGRKTAQAQKNNALAGALGSLAGAGLGALGGGGFGALFGSQAGGSLASGANPLEYGYTSQGR